MFMKRFSFALQSKLEVGIQEIQTNSNNFQVLKNEIVLKNFWNEDLILTTPQLIEKNGYPCETYKVTTEDGYILTLHRIPHGRSNSNRSSSSVNSQPKPIALFQSGAFCSSSVWVMTPPDRALAFRLADQGYDVFLGNNRGTTYSKAHVSLSVNSEKYWDFSWHEMGMYDVPAVIDYILNMTGQKDLYYLGHSMGTTMFFVCMSLRPEYNSKVRLMSALAPVAFMEHLISPCAYLAPFVKQLGWWARYLNLHQLFPNNLITKFLGITLGHPWSPFQSILIKFLFNCCGYNYKLLDKTILPVILGHVPAGISTKCLKHYAQGINSGEFRQYDYGRKRNELVYDQATPPDYEISKIKTPIALYYSNNDWLAALSDVHRLADGLRSVVKSYCVPFDGFNHMDFLWGLSVSSLLNDEIETEMEIRKSNNPALTS